MSQVDKTTNRLYAACAKAIKGDAHDAFVAIALDEGSMAGFTEATDGLATESTISGLGRAAGTVTLATVAAANDQVCINIEMAAGAGATINGFGVFNGTVAEAATGLMQFCAFAASQVLAVDDKLNNTAKCQFKLGV